MEERDSKNRGSGGEYGREMGKIEAFKDRPLPYMFSVILSEWKIQSLPGYVLRAAACVNPVLIERHLDSLLVSRTLKRGELSVEPAVTHKCQTQCRIKFFCKKM